MTDLVDVVELGALLGPVAVAHAVAVLRESRQHDDHHAALLPHHLPEVIGSLRQRSLREVTWSAARGVLVRRTGPHLQRPRW